MRPPCFMTMPYDSDRPRPVPLPTALVVKKGSKMRRRCSGATPAPLSVTVSTAHPWRSVELEISRVCERPGQLAIELGIDAARARQAILFAGEDHALLMTFPASATLPEGFLAIGLVEACEEGENPHVALGGTAISENGWNPYTGWNGETS